MICDNCSHNCDLSEGKTGLCHARSALQGKIVCDNYGAVTSLALDPIEKKPLKMFHPKSMILSVGSYGCNMRCMWCQNDSISRGYVEADHLTPEELVQIATDTKARGNIGIAFAVSAEIAKTVADTLIQHGEIVRPWLGIIGARPSQLRSPGEENEDLQKGAVIRGIIQNSPADLLGLREGDVIVKLDGVDVPDTYELRNRILGMDPGTIVKITVLRRNLLHETSVKLERAPKEWFRRIPQIDYAIPL